MAWLLLNNAPETPVGHGLAKGLAESPAFPVKVVRQLP